ncbi:MAG: hypothetical protein QHC90_24725 [Shinella sp.]|jgi:hypothetical protein|nr:hypothetical protein [Shinella sp.]
MSSDITPNAFPANLRMLRLILARAGFVSAEMKPLDGVEHTASLDLIKRFNDGVIYPSFR